MSFGFVVNAKIKISSLPTAQTTQKTRSGSVQYSVLNVGYIRGRKLIGVFS